MSGSNLILNPMNNQITTRFRIGTFEMSNDATDALRGNETRQANAQHVVRLDLDQLQQIAMVGVRRVAAFLAIGLNSTSTGEPPSLELSAESMFRFFPDPVPNDLTNEALREFRAWVIGNGLRELDTHFNRFLDAVWPTIQLARLHGQEVSWSFTPEDISADTNASKKFSKIMREIGGDDSEAGRLWSLSNVRNCLTHGAGIVAKRHANDDDRMKVIWLGLETRIRQDGVETVIKPVIGPEGLTAPDPSKDAELVAALVERERQFEIGQSVTLEPWELHEICFYYSRLTGLVTLALTAFFAGMGVPHEDPPSGSG